MTTSRVEENRGRFRKGRAKTGGRSRGTPNRATRAWKEFVAELVNDPAQQQALADAIKAHHELLFKAAEHAVGKPRQALDLDQSLAGGLVIRWQDDLATRIENGRKRIADARDHSEED
jgi:hypothetical protein